MISEAWVTFQKLDNVSTGYHPQGCYKDNQTRILDVKKYQSDGNTLEKCEAACREEDFLLFGVENR